MSALEQLPLPPEVEVAMQRQASTQISTQQQQQHTDEMTTPPPPPPPPLEPFFTLLTNTTTGTTIHPRVQYLFSDDDLSALVTYQPPSSSLSASSSLPPSTRPLIVDLVPTPDNASWTVSWASSLTPEFALTSSCITVQPDSKNSYNDEDNKETHTAAAAAAEDKSTMLRLEGVEREPPCASRPGSPPGSGSGATLGKEDVEALAEEFRRRFAVLRKVVGESEKRRVIFEEAQAQASTQAQTQAQDQSTSSAHAREQAPTMLDQAPLHHPERLDDGMIVEGESPRVGGEDAVRRGFSPGVYEEVVEAA
ncbi:hypothetical protein E4U46_003757 [Claviceps purpurea]|nr:hypothetical protein E4U51_006082 [Claviceps purpurea]KAG6223352.1 hypothetical protein E4U26_004619 [Claviceps purpurea]KAG6295845.1 hypothetical protein E4U46_003757 [Claviceps purpurea]